MRYRAFLNGLIALSLLSSAGCSRTVTAVRPEILSVLPPAALLVPRQEPGCRAARNRDLVACILDLRTWGRQAEADKAALSAWRKGAESMAIPTPEPDKGWWPWSK